MIKKLHTGLIVFDWLDLLCISFSVGGLTSYLFQKYSERDRDPIDPIVTELKENSRILIDEDFTSISIVSTEGNSLKLPLVRGGKRIKKGISLAIRNKKLAAFLKALLETKRNQRLVKLLQIYLGILNQLLTYGVGIRFAVGGSLHTTQIILITVSGSVGGFLVGQILGNPLATVLFPLVILFGRGVEEIPDPHEKCKFICQVAEDFHNKEHLMEMQKLNSLIEETSNKLKLPLDQVPLLSVECVKEEFSILQRFKLRQLIESVKVKKRVRHFNEFIKKFPECSIDLEEIAEEVIEKTPE
jgi:hypothetical protein